MFKNLKILLGKNRKIKTFATSKVEVVLFDKQNYRVAVRTIEGFTWLVDNRLDWYNQGLQAEKIIREKIDGNYRTIYKLAPIK